MPHAPTLKLSREIRFALHDSSQPTPPNAANSFAAEPALLDIAPYLTLTATLAGSIDPATGMLINIKLVDKILRQHAIPTLRDGHFHEPRTRAPPPSSTMSLKISAKNSSPTPSTPSPSTSAPTCPSPSRSRT